MKKIERVLKALANKRRLAILKYLQRYGESSVTDLAHGIRLSLTATSKHLIKLHAADILDSRKESLVVYYRVNSKAPLPTRQILSTF